jgi:hypothetical protein
MWHMSVPPAPAPAATGAPSTESGEPSPPGVGSPRQVNLRQRIDDALRWVRRNAPLVAGVLAAAMALLLVVLRLSSARGRARKGPILSASPLTYRVFATREGLVGGTTANGHVIVPRDHFVALPSRRALSPRGTGTYSVKVCADNGRCETAPVWDVGPWNTRDDYWNPPAIRENWKDLPQGTPEAQAAYQNGYNGGKDQYGRRVTNPAGIDLADGTFWDGLGLTGNTWVTVTYLWT